MPTHKASPQRKTQTTPKSVSQTKNQRSTSHPLMQMQRAVGNQAVTQMMKDQTIQRNGDKGGKKGGLFGGMLGGMFSGMRPAPGTFKNFGHQVLNQSVREGVSAGFGSDSGTLYDMWKLRKDPKMMDQYVMDNIVHRMDGGYQ